MRDVIMAIFGISHTVNTMVGNDFIRGVSGGERKRVSIAEATLAGAPLQCWDNSTRGLDSANAIEFVKNLRMGAQYFGTTSAVAIYQAPQAAYDLFDKVSVLYEGEQIFFGPCTKAKQFFVEMGFYCPEQQTTPDFLTSLTSTSERTPRQGFEGKVPRTPKQFAERWRASPECAALQQQVANYNQRFPPNGEAYDTFLASRRAQQSKHIRPGSPYTLSYGGQIKLCLDRGFQRLKADPSLTISQLLGNAVMALIIASIFYNLQPNTASFYNRGGLVFFAILMNAFGSALEILTLYAQRDIVEKHARYAFYHPSAEAFASMLTDMPYKICNSIIFNLIIYFMTNLRRSPGPFFFFFFVSFLCTLVMSMLFRSIASLSRSLTQALAPAAVIILALVIYTGFALPINYMHGWSRWMNYLDPIAYGFEALMINEFYGRQFACANLVPQGPGYPTSGDGVACAAVGNVPGQAWVDGERYLELAYQYKHSHKWRNVGLLFVFMFGLMAVYLAAAEFITAKRSKGEVLIYPRGKIPEEFRHPRDEETAEETKESALSPKLSNLDAADNLIQRQTAIFSWRDVCYDIKIKGQPRRILDHVDGWVKPGTLTALMGVSGAGKTTLLDVLATRVTMGVVSGEMLVDGRQRDVSFQRKTGYVQQQDLHLQTSTVREALRFSAVLRQPKSVPREEKYTYVEDVLKLLEMDGYADAVVGIPGEGLNVEQRKRLTIGVELVAKPELLLFLDEPTSGLDSQTSWNILQLLQKLTANGQAILCTIHQPSAMLFEQFDRLLFLAKGGRTVYYGEVGHQSRILIDYFVRTGAPPCPPGENPAEWMLSAIGAAPGSHTDVDWHQAWLDSPERVAVRQELDNIKHERRAMVPKADPTNNKVGYAEFAAPFGVQFFEVVRRVFQQYWRTPSYIWSKLILVGAVGLFVGFSFYRADTSQQGLQNQLFSIFMVFTVFGQLVQQIMPNFVIQRGLYEVRERPSKTYSWPVFILSNIVVEIPWSILCGTMLFFEFYYPTGFYKNAIPTDSVTIRGVQMWLMVEMFMLFTSTFATMVIAGIELAETGGNIANLLFSLCLVFCGVLVPLNSLPGFWKFMNRVSPFTYMVEAMLSVGVANTNVVCSATELIRFNPQGTTCGEYIAPFIGMVGGYMSNPDATADCAYCAMNETNTFLAAFNIYYSNFWRNFGIMWVYVIVNIFGAIGLYWLARVPKNKKTKDDDDNNNLQRSTTDATGVSRAITKDKIIPASDEKVFTSTVSDQERITNMDSPYGAAPATATDTSTRVPSPVENTTNGNGYVAR
jgi:ATP-binding cassette subfamily G (WHITE) protein 2 (PDR)